jgi:prophage antirepressor-like protein
MKVVNEKLKVGAVAANLAEFKFDEYQVRTAVKDQVVWFVLADVCEVLKHSNPRMVITRLDEDEKGVTNVYTLRGVQEMNIVNESGLYSLIIRSRLPKAKGVIPKMQLFLPFQPVT